MTRQTKKKKKVNIIEKFIIFLGVVFIALVVACLILFFTVKHLKIKEIVEHEIESELGINVTIEKIELSPLLTHICAKGITIHNPPGFSEDELAYIDSIHVVCDPIEIIAYKKPNIYLFAVDLKRLNIEKNKQGKINIKEIDSVKQSGAEDTNPVYFNVVVLNVGDIKYTDYSGKNKSVHKYHIGMKNAAFVDIKNEDDVVKMIIYKAIQNTNLGKMINWTMGPVYSNIKITADSAWGTAKTGVKGAWEILCLPAQLLIHTSTPQSD